MMDWATVALLAASTVAAPPPSVPTFEQITAVPPELQAKFQAEVLDKNVPKDKRLRLLTDFVFGKPGLGLEYDAGATGTVAETYRSRKANCLSFTLLFATLARQAGLKTRVQEYEQVLVWYQQDGLVFNSSHVNVKIEAGSLRQTVDVGRNALISRYKPKPIDDRRVLSFFYNNRGVESMAAGDEASAERYFQAAIATEADDPASRSNLGVLRLREGDLKGAERAYLAALDIDSTHGAALANIVTLYRRSGQKDREAKYTRKLRDVQYDDPFHQFLLGVDRERHGDYAAAVAYFRRAIRLHGDEPEFYLALARAYAQLGDSRRAQRAASRAEVISGENRRRALQAKNEERRQRAGSVARQVNF